MNFEKEMKEKVKEVQAVIDSYLPEESGFQRTLLEAMNYSMTAGGKRLRPLMMLETYRLFGGTSGVIRPFLAAIEMIHTHSLIHDDLPAMDNDEYRRGRKTTHVVYGEAMGILAGDGLLNFAYETAARAFEMEPDNKNVGKAFRVLTSKTGIYGMIGGQSVDVEMAGQPLSAEKLDFIYRLKTSALIEGAMMTGAILAGASDEKIDKIQQIAQKVGIAFQIQDDILDMTSSMAVLGKPINSDEKNHKTTYVTLYGLEDSRKKVEGISREAIALLDSLEEKNEFLRALILSLIYREK
ncbi:MAG: farnesyl diphosphate synthase [Lachnospiraceae bacterium]|nr:polyprenyl synthetase family protein [Robinsoniella sp.]MDY3766486.1 farnesyl diphosphate synthase [Lachnospiraceae bacterium]